MNFKQLRPYICGIKCVVYHSLIDGCFLNEGTIGILALSELDLSIGLINTGENFQAAKD